MTQGHAEDRGASEPFPQMAVLNRAAWYSRWRDRAGSTYMANQICAAAQAQDPLALSLAGEALRTLAWQAKWLGKFREAERHCLEAERHFAPAGTPPAALVDVYAIQCIIAYSRNDFTGAQEFISTARRLLRHDMPVETRLDVMASEALLMRHTGHPEAALEMIEAAQALATGTEAARLAHNRARLLNQLGREAAASQAAEAALRLARSYQNRVVLPYACEVHGFACRKEGRFAEAAASLKEGLACADEDGDQRAACQILEQKAMLALDQGDADRALTLLRRGLAIAEQISYPLWQRQFLRKLAQEYERRGEAQEALAAYKRLLAMLDNTPV